MDKQIDDASPEQRCSFCRVGVGTGRGLLTAAELANVRGVANTPKVPQIHGKLIRVTIIMCIKCAEGLATQLINAHKTLGVYQPGDIRKFN